MGFGDQVVHILKSYVLKSFTLAFAILLIVMVIWLAHGYQTGAYWNAKRARSKGNTKQAIGLFKDSVYEDKKGLSYKALLALEGMDDVMALEALIDLLDIPEMNWVSWRTRTPMCDVIRKRTAGTTADKLQLDPSASQNIRGKQKQQWEAWFASAKKRYDWVEGRFVPRRRSTRPAID